jgi:hypothetical protein
MYDPLGYALLFPKGQFGWHFNMNYNDGYASKGGFDLFKNIFFLYKILSGRGKFSYEKIKKSKIIDVLYKVVREQGNLRKNKIPKKIEIIANNIIENVARKSPLTTPIADAAFDV